MEIDDHKFLKLMSEAVKLGYTMCCIDLAVIPQYYTMNQAYAKHKRPTVDQWIRKGRILPVIRNKRKYLDRIKLDTIASTSLN